MTSRTNILALRQDWAHLPAPTPDELTGDFEASFVTPLQQVAPIGLGWVGLPRWYGKRFRREGDVLIGTNLVRTPRGLQERLPMTARLAASLIDGGNVMAISYAGDAPVPWRWIRDELRLAPDGTIVAMTLVRSGGLHRLGGLPFLLRRT